MTFYGSSFASNYGMWIDIWIALMRHSHEWSFIRQKPRDLLKLRYLCDTLPDVLMNEELAESMLKSPLSMKRT